MLSGLVDCASPAYCSNVSRVHPLRPAIVLCLLLLAIAGTSSSAGAFSRTDAGWTTRSMPTTQPFLEGVKNLSCTDRRFCIATVSLTQQGTNVPAYVIFDGTHWSSPRIISRKLVALDGLACASRTYCVAAVRMDGAPFSEATVVFNGSSWGKPIRDARTPTQFVCAAARFCVGTTLWTTSVQYPPVEFNGSRWRPAVTPPPNLIAGRTWPACTSPAFCIVFMEDQTRNGGIWYSKRTRSGWSAPVLAATDPDLASPICASPTFCVSFAEYGAAYVFNGQSWQKTSLSFGSSPYEVPASCPTRTFCMVIAVGEMMRYDGRRWLKSFTPPSGSVPRFISCPSAGFCVLTYASNMYSIYSK